MWSTFRLRTSLSSMYFPGTQCSLSRPVIPRQVLSAWITNNWSHYQFVSPDSSQSVQPTKPSRLDAYRHQTNWRTRSIRLPYVQLLWTICRLSIISHQDHLTHSCSHQMRECPALSLIDGKEISESSPTALFHLPSSCFIRIKNQDDWCWRQVQSSVAINLNCPRTASFYRGCSSSLLPANLSVKGNHYHSI